MSKWTLLGSHPGAVDNLLKCQGTIISTNGAIEFERPDIYFLSDWLACDLYKDGAKWFQSQGTKVITVDKAPRTVYHRQMQWVDEVLETHTSRIVNKDMLSKFTLSGMACLEYACLNGATEIHMIGVEGYSGKNDYYNGECHRDPVNKTERMRLCIQKVIDFWSDVQFIHHTQTHLLKLTGDNYKAV